MGEVFRARDERLGRDVALKLIRQSSGDKPDHLRRFEFEARAAAALNHPNIVAVYDVGSTDGTPFIVCELLEGRTLRQQLQAGPLPPRIALDYCLQIAQGLIAAHDRRIVHRDLKPENLFVTNDGRIKILDFGVAKLQPTDDSGRSVEELTTVTKAGSVVGTVAYMSPEQLRGKTIDHRSDIFSVGAILYEMLTGSRAFHGETEVDTITAVLREEPSEAKLEETNIPISMQKVVRHCLEKEPQNRFQSARDLSFALETLPEAQGIGKPLSKPRKSKQNFLLGAVVGVIGAAVAVLLVLRPWKGNATLPSYQRLTYEQGTVYSARFTPDFRGVVYGAAWNGRAQQLFSTVGNSLLSQALNLSDARLSSVSTTGELALVLRGKAGAHLGTSGGVLALAPLAGGSPREVLNDVSWADWDANGKLAVVHHVNGRDRIEYPTGHVLYETTGWVSYIRVSPHGEKIAFMDHPTLWDDRGSVDVVDLSAKVNVVSNGWESEDGLAWGPDGKEIWFTAVEKGENRELMAATTSGRVRKVLALPASMTLEDVSPDGRVLVSLDSERLAMASASRGGKPVDLSWHDWSVVREISRDNQWVLFEDSSETSGSQYSTAIRKIDGSPPARLAMGSAGGLSPDGKWALSIAAGSPGQVSLVPTGVGEPRIIPTPELERIHSGAGHFLDDGKRFTINASERGHGVRSYLLDIDGDKPVPVTPEGITVAIISPDGKYVLRPDDAGVLSIYSVPQGEGHAIPNLAPGFSAVQWSSEESSVFGYDRDASPTSVYKVNVKTGQQTFVQQLRPAITTGVVSIAPVAVARDGSRFAYSYYQVFSVLYLISGLQ